MMVLVSWPTLPTVFPLVFFKPESLAPKDPLSSSSDFCCFLSYSSGVANLVAGKYTIPGIFTFMNGIAIHGIRIGGLHAYIFI